MNDTIWFINEYAGSPYHGMSYRHYYLAREMAKQGVKPVIISASYSHLLNNLPGKNEEIIDGVRYKWLNVPHYTESQSKWRVLKWLVFSFKLFFLSFSRLPSPDYIIVSPTALFPIVPAFFLAKKFKAKLIFEVRDIWPLTLIEIGGYKPAHPFVRLMTWMEQFALRKSDLIVSNLQNYGSHIRNLGINRDVVWISNGIDLDEVTNADPLDSDIAGKIPKGKFIVGYAGKIGITNALECFLSAKKYINNDQIVFVVVGDGQEKKLLESKYAADDIIFLPSVPKKQVQSTLACFDLCYIGWKNELIYQFGVSANKIFDYMYSAKPVVHAINTTNDIVSLSGCGVNVEAENPAAIAAGIDALFAMPREELEHMGQRGRDYVLKYFTYKALAAKYLEAISKQ